IRDTLIEGFSHFVTSMTAAIASGGSESPGGACTHWNAPHCHGARPSQALAPNRSRPKKTQDIAEFGREDDRVGIAIVWRRRSGYRARPRRQDHPGEDGE